MTARAIKFTNGYKWAILIAINLVGIGVAWGKITTDMRNVQHSIERLECKVDKQSEEIKAVQMIITRFHPYAEQKSSGGIPFSGGAEIE